MGRVGKTRRITINHKHSIIFDRQNKRAGRIGGNPNLSVQHARTLSRYQKSRAGETYECRKVQKGGTEGKKLKSGK